MDNGVALGGVRCHFFNSGGGGLQCLLDPLGLAEKSAETGQLCCKSDVVILSPEFAAEGQYAVQARDATWAALYAFMADVQAGTQPVPTGFADVEPLLPALEWPQ